MNEGMSSNAIGTRSDGRNLDLSAPTIGGAPSCWNKIDLDLCDVRSYCNHRTRRTFGRVSTLVVEDFFLLSPLRPASRVA